MCSDSDGPNRLPAFLTGPAAPFWITLWLIIVMVIILAVAAIVLVVGADLSPYIEFLGLGGGIAGRRSG